MRKWASDRAGIDSLTTTTEAFDLPFLEGGGVVNAVTAVWLADDSMASNAVLNISASPQITTPGSRSSCAPSTIRVVPTSIDMNARAQIVRACANSVLSSARDNGPELLLPCRERRAWLSATNRMTLARDEDVWTR